MSSLLLTSLATFYITYIILYTDGPFDIFIRLRSKYDTKLLECPWCLSIYIALAVSLLVTQNILELLLLAFASAGTANIIMRFIK